MKQFCRVLHAMYAFINSRPFYKLVTLHKLKQIYKSSLLNYFRKNGYKHADDREETYKTRRNSLLLYKPRY